MLKWKNVNYLDFKTDFFAKIFFLHHTKSRINVGCKQDHCQNNYINSFMPEFIPNCMLKNTFIVYLMVNMT